MRRTVRIAGVAIGVSCAIPEAEPVLDALLAPYPRARRPRLRFRIEPAPAGAALLADDALLWEGDLAETLAGFEVHFYLRALAHLPADILSIHGAWFAWGGRTVLAVAESGGGKSSLATAAVLDRALYGSDEFALLGPDGRLHPFPRPLQWGRVRHPAFPHAAMRAAGLAKARLCFRDHEGRRRLNLWWLPRRVARTPRRPDVVAFVAWTRNAPPTAEPLSRAPALMALAPHLHHRLPAREALQALHARLAPSTRFFRLRFGDARAAAARLRALAA